MSKNCYSCDTPLKKGVGVKCTFCQHVFHVQRARAVAHSTVHTAALTMGSTFICANSNPTDIALANSTDTGLS